jgi:hypothetical protein
LRRLVQVVAAWTAPGRGANDAAGGAKRRRLDQDFQVHNCLRQLGSLCFIERLGEDDFRAEAVGTVGGEAAVFGIVNGIAVSRQTASNEKLVQLIQGVQGLHAEADGDPIYVTGGL